MVLGSWLEREREREREREMWLEGKRSSDSIKRLGRRECRKWAAATRKEASDACANKLQNAFNALYHSINLFHYHYLNFGEWFFFKRFPHPICFFHKFSSYNCFFPKSTTVIHQILFKFYPRIIIILHTIKNPKSDELFSATLKNWKLMIFKSRKQISLVCTALNSLNSSHQLFITFFFFFPFFFISLKSLGLHKEGENPLDI